MAKSKRVHTRIKRRVTCDVQVGETRHAGLVMDLSAGGFFVQTGALADIGASVDLALRGRGGETIEVSARVTNRRAIPRRLATVVKGGLGCALTCAPEPYYRMLAELDVR